MGRLRTNGLSEDWLVLAMAYATPPGSGDAEAQVEIAINFDACMVVFKDYQRNIGCMLNSEKSAEVIAAYQKLLMLVDQAAEQGFEASSALSALATTSPAGNG